MPNRYRAGTVKLTFRLQDSERQALQALAARLGEPVNTLLRRLVQGLIEDEGASSGPVARKGAAALYASTGGYRRTYVWRGHDEERRRTTFMLRRVVANPLRGSPSRRKRDPDEMKTLIRATRRKILHDPRVRRTGKRTFVWE